MSFETPQSTNEAILQNMLGASNALKPPQSRVEKLLQELSGQMPEANPSTGTTTGTLERLKIGDDIYTVDGGGSGGTSDYDALNNKPQIAGTTLSGNKSLADLGIASATAVSGILDGTDIDSFGDVETALGDKVDKVDGKGLSSNDYTNEDKAIVGGVTTALANKVDKVDGKGLSSNDFTDAYKTAIGENTTAISGIKNGTSINSFAGVETALNGKQNTLTFDNAPTENSNNPVKSGGVYTALAGKQDTLTFDNTPTEDSNNPVKSNGIYDALALKQNATDNSLQTTDKTIPGAINEVKSGLTNLATDADSDFIQIVMSGDGRYYEYSFTHPFTLNRVMFMVMRGTQLGSITLSTAMYFSNFSDAVNVTSSDANITSELVDGTLKLKVDAGSNAWVQPVIIMPRYIYKKLA